MPLTAAGLGSGLDVNSMVGQLMQAERQPLVALKSRVTTYDTQLSAYGKVQGALSTLQSALGALESPAALKALTSASSDASVASATASSDADAGTYEIEVLQLAQKHKLASASFEATTTVVGTGSLKLQLGTYSGGVFTPNPAKAALDITVAGATSTLSGLRDAINTANAGVTASLVNDGTGYRLVLTSADGGSANSLKITVIDDDADNTSATGLSQLAFDPAASAGAGKNLAELSGAQNALVKLDGISLTQGTNVITGAIDGLTLNLAKIGNTTIQVAQDTAQTTTVIGALVSAYNSFNKTVRDLTGYDAETKLGGPLIGDAGVRRVQSQMRAMLGGMVSGLPEGLNALSHIGISFQSDGSLAVNSAKLAGLLTSNFSAVSAILAATGSATDSSVQYSGAGAATQSGTYAVTVSQLATQGGLGGSAPAVLDITQDVNDTLSVNVDGTATSVKISPGTYASAAALALAVQAAINADPAVQTAALGVSVSESGGVLSIISNSYSSGSAVTLSGGSAALDLFGASPVASAGLDVAGTINASAATGTGRLLSAQAGNAAADLRVLINGGTTGARGTVTYSIGSAAGAGAILDTLLASDGTISARTTGIQSSIKLLNESSDAMEERLTAIEARYRAQFTALDRMMAQMNSTSSFLTAQLGKLL